MGGVWVDKDGRTSMPELYAAGETACNGVTARTAWLQTACSRRWSGVVAPRGICVPASHWPWSTAGDPALDGRHRALGAGTLAIDDLARAAGTQAVEE